MNAGREVQQGEDFFYFLNGEISSVPVAETQGSPALKILI